MGNLEKEKKTLTTTKIEAFLREIWFTDVFNSFLSMRVRANRAPTPRPRGKIAILISLWVHGLNVLVLHSRKSTKKFDLETMRGPVQPMQRSAKVEEENKHLLYLPALLGKVITSSYHIFAHQLVSSTTDF